MVAACATACRAVRAARRLRDHARQRRHDRVLGRRGVRSHRAAQPAPLLRRVLVEVRRRRGTAPRSSTRRRSSKSEPGTRPDRGRRRRRRRLRPHAQRDVDRRDDAARGRVDGADRGRARRSSTPPRPPAGCCSTRRTRRLLLRPAEVLRLRRRAVDRRAARRPPSSASSASRARTGGCRRRSISASPSRTRARTRPTTRPRWRRSSWPCTRSTGSTTKAASRWAAAAATARPSTSTPGPRRRDFATPFVADPTERSHVVATIDLDDRVDATTVARRPAGQRHRRHRALPQARPQPAARRALPRHRARRRPRPHAVHRPRRVRHELTSPFPGLGACPSRPYVPESFFITPTHGARDFSTAPFVGFLPWRRTS